MTTLLVSFHVLYIKKIEVLFVILHKYSNINHMEYYKPWSNINQYYKPYGDIIYLKYYICSCILIEFYIF